MAHRNYVFYRGTYDLKNKKIVQFHATKDSNGNSVDLTFDCEMEMMSSNKSKTKTFDLGRIGNEYCLVTIDENMDNIEYKKYDATIMIGESDDIFYWHDKLINESKENKNMKKSIKERFEAPRDWDFEEMVEEYGMEYLAESNPDVEPYSMDEFNELTNYRDDPLEAITRAFYGGRYGFKNDSFFPMDEYFAYDGAGNLISIKDYVIDDYLKEHIDEEYFYEWCVDNGYFESEDDE